MYVTDDMGYGYQDGLYAGIVCLTRDGLVDYADYRAGKYEDVIVSQESLMEKIQSVEETEDQITVSCFMDEKKLEKIVGDERAHSLETTYVLDADTYGIKTISGILTLDDSTTTDVYMECALLFETGFEQFVDEVILVTAHLETRIQRIMNRDQVSREKALAWIALQMPEEEKERRAHHIIRND
jgi:dephospho-CoA kinase